MTQPDELHDPEDFGRKPRPQGMSTAAMVATGFGCMIVVVLIGVAVTTFWVANNLQVMAAGLMKAAIEGVNLPDAQERRILTRIDELAEQIRRG